MPDFSTSKRRLRRSLRRWLWFGLLGLAAVAALAVAVFYLATVRPDRRSAPYQQAMERLQANASAARLLGEPVEAGWWVRGSVQPDSARLAVPVSGSERSGVLQVEADKAGGSWTFSRLELAVYDNSVRLSLLEEERQGRNARR